MTPLSDRAQIVDGNGRATRALIAFFQSIFSGTIPRTAYTAVQLDGITPELNLTAICSDSSVSTIGSTLAGGGTTIVQVIGNGTAWKVI